MLVLFDLKLIILERIVIIAFVMAWLVGFLGVLFGLVWCWFFLVGFFELKAGKTKVCQTASHRACFIQGGTDFIAFEDFWA